MKLLKCFTSSVAVDASYDCVRFEDEYPSQAAWLMRWYANHSYLHGVPRGYWIHFNSFGFTFVRKN